MQSNTMDKKTIRILFMDDLIDDPNEVLLRDAVKTLREKGFEVTTVATMSQAMDAFYQCFYKVFVLDIDMTHVPDSLDGRGTRVASWLRELDNQTRVVMYSGMGTAADLFQVVNRHVYGYVFKNAGDPVQKLVDTVIRAADEPFIGQVLPESKKSGLILVASRDIPAFEPEQLEQAMKGLGDFQFEKVPVKELSARLRDKAECVAVFLGRPEFPTSPDVIGALKQICACQPSPQVVIGCNCTDADFNALLSIANLRPFRLVAANAVDATAAAARALAEAAHWYRGNETFPAEPGYIHRVGPDIDWATLKADLDAETLPFPEEGDENDPADGEER